MDIRTPGIVSSKLLAQRFVAKQPSSTFQKTNVPQDQFMSVPKVKLPQKIRFGTVQSEKTPTELLQQQGVLVAGAAGTMGQDILQNARQGMFNTYAMDMNLKGAQKALAQINDKLLTATAKGIVKEDAFWDIHHNTKAEALDGQRLEKPASEGGYSPEDFPQVGLVVEAIFENMAVKKKLFGNIEQRVNPKTILATNTSTLSVNEMAEGLQHPERFIGLHYFLPAVSNRLVEVIPGKLTSPEVVKQTINYARAIGKVPVLVKHDSPGFAANRLLITAAAEALHLYEDGYGSAETIDKIANKMLWGKLADMPMAQKSLMPPFVLFQKYGGLGVEIAQNIGKLGPYYKPSNILLNEHQRVQEVVKGPLKRAKSLRDDVEKSYNEAVLAWQKAEAGKNTEASKTLAAEFKIEEQQKLLARSREEVAKLEAEAKYFGNGYPKVDVAGRHETPDAKKQIIENRLYGALYGAAIQMVSEGLCEKEDIDNIAHLGFKWSFAPFASMQQQGPEKVKAALDAIKTRYGNDFKIPELPDTELNYVKTRLSEKNGALFITLDRVQSDMGAENFNTLASVTLRALKKTVEDAQENPKVKAIVIESNGGKVFSGGANLDEIKDNLNLPAVEKFVQLGLDTMNTIAASKKPTIAKVQGDAYGGGVELALACDKIVASHKATFTLPEVKLALFPGWGGPDRLAGKIGKPMAHALIGGGQSKIGALDAYFKAIPGLYNLVNQKLKWGINTPGSRLDAQTAHRLGLIHVLTSSQGLDDTVDQLLEQPEFLQKFDPQKTDPAIDPHRGLKRYQRAEDYPADIAQQFHLATIQQENVKNAGRFSQAGLALSTRMIENAGTDKAGKYTQNELKVIIENVAARNQKLMQLVDSAIAGANGNKMGSMKILAKAIATDKYTVPALLKSVVTLPVRIGASVFRPKSK